MNDTPPRSRVAILDDYLGIALESADWDAVAGFADVEVFTEKLDAGQLAERLADFDIVSVMRERTAVTADLMAALPRLRMIASTAVKNAAIDLDAATRRGIVVCGTRSFAHPTAELTWALILASLRNIAGNHDRVRSGGWQVRVGESVLGSTLGVVGLGNAGKRVAAIGRQFGAEVIAWSQNLTEEDAAAVGVRRVDKDELFGASDIVTVHLRLSERTHHLVGADEIRSMKPGALLVNTSRGEIVDEAALVAALRAREIGGAALDVYDREPLPAGHPFLTLGNVLLSPHMGYVARDNMALFYGDTVENIVAFRQGEPIRVMNPAVLQAPR